MIPWMNEESHSRQAVTLYVCDVCVRQDVRSSATVLRHLSTILHTPVCLGLTAVPEVRPASTVTTLHLIYSGCLRAFHRQAFGIVITGNEPVREAILSAHERVARTPSPSY